MNIVEIGGIIIDIQYEDNYNKIFKVKCINGEIYNITCQIYSKVYKFDCIYAACTVTVSTDLNYYHILGIKMDASIEEIKIAYKKNAIIYHPDKNDGNDVQFKLCLDAYQCLLDSKTRAEHEIECKKHKIYYVPIKQPFILIAKDENSIIISIVRILSIKHAEAYKFYRKLVNLNDNVYEYVTSLAEQWYHNKDPTIIELFDDNEYNLEKFLDKWYVEYNTRQLNLLGLTNKEIKQFDLPCDIIYNKCLDNPYTIYSIKIEKADQIMNMMNKPINKVERERGIIVRKLWDNTEGRKYMCTPSKYLCSQFTGIKCHIDQLKEHYNFVVDDGLVYLKKYHQIETFIANYVINAVKTPLESSYETMYSRDDLSDDQQNAIAGSLKHKLSFICGGPGVGKSTIIAELVHNFESNKVKYLLTSFTGKAVCKIREVTKMDTAKTMHRLINEAKKSKVHYDVKAVIIDEISMVTLELLYNFLIQYKNIEQLICIGDVNQLQPIDAGCFLEQVIKSETVPIYYLTTNHRVVVKPGEIDGILCNAHAIINHDKEYPFEFTETDNFTIIEADINAVFELVNAFKQSGIKCTNMTIVTPYNICVEQLNKGCQAIFHENDPYVMDSRSMKWYQGDRVMLTKNIQSINIFNGQQGFVKSITDYNITIVFDDSDKEHLFVLEPKTKVNLKEEEEDDYDIELSVLKLQHCYATTITKSQGSEYDLVILYIPADAKETNFLNKHLFYTSMTRSKRFFYAIVSNKQLLINGVTRIPSWRCEGLYKRLITALPKIKPNIINDYEYDETEYTDADYDQY